MSKEEVFQILMEHPKLYCKEEFFKKSMDIGLSKNLSKTFLKNLLKDIEKNYNNYV